MQATFTLVVTRWGEPRCPLSSDPRLGTVRQAVRLGSAALRSSPAPHRLQRLQAPAHSAAPHNSLPSPPPLNPGPERDRPTDRLFPSLQPTLYTHGASPLPSSSTRGKLPEELLKFVAVAPKGRGRQGHFPPKMRPFLYITFEPWLYPPLPRPGARESREGGGADRARVQR